MTYRIKLNLTEYQVMVLRGALDNHRTRTVRRHCEVSGTLNRLIEQIEIQPGPQTLTLGIDLSSLGAQIFDDQLEAALLGELKLRKQERVDVDSPYMVALITIREMVRTWHQNVREAQRLHGIES